MKKNLFITFIIIILINLVLTPTFAKVSDIRFEKIPNSNELAKIKETMFSLEPIVTYWTPNWNYDIPKDKVVNQIVDAYQKVDTLAKNNPDNIELILFKGLIAYYAYQLDLQDYYQFAINDFNQALQMDPSDIRPKWFSGVHLAKSGKIKKGMEHLLEVSKSKPYRELPGNFWEDFSYCALLSGMPSHALMGLDYANEIEGKESETAKTFGSIIRNKLKQPPTETQVVSKDDIWGYVGNNETVTFTNRLFGFSLQIPSEWGVRLGDYQKGNTSIMIRPPAKTGLTGEVNSTIMILAHKPKDGEEFDTFVNSLLDPKFDFQQVEKTFMFGPVKAFEGESKTIYSNESGAHNVIIFFARNQPEKPGLLLENPTDIPANGSSEVAHYRSQEEFNRLLGTIFYAVLLDTTQSTFLQSEFELQVLLNTLVVE